MLDRMLSGMIKQATGLDTRRVVRKVGAKNILLAGGAALAGTMAAKKFNTPATGTYSSQPGDSQPGGSYGGGPSQAPGATPPPPPPPPVASAPPPPPGASTVVPPPPPGAPAPASSPNEEDALSPQLLFATVRTMVAAALADGELAAEERSLIEEQLGSGELDAAQVSRVRQDFTIPATPGELAALLCESVPPAALYRAAVLVIRADEEVSAAERAWLAGLATALGLSPEGAQALEDDLSRVFAAS